MAFKTSVMASTNLSVLCWVLLIQCWRNMDLIPLIPPVLIVAGVRTKRQSAGGGRGGDHKKIWKGDLE